MAKPKLQNPIEVHFDVLSRYHYFVFGLLFLSKMPLFMNVISLLFTAPPMDFYCEDTGQLDNTTKNLCPCERPKWDRSVFTETMQTKFGTQCEKKWLVGLSHSLFYSGSLIGSLIFGFLSDKIGRVSTYCFCLLITAIFGVTMIAMPTIAAYSFIRFLHGTGIGGAIVSGYVLCVEYCGVRQRSVVTALFHIPLNIGHMSLAGVSYLLRDCDDLTLAITIPLFFFLPMQWWVMESPKWLMDSNQIEKAAAAMDKLCKFSRTSYGHIKESMEEYQRSRSTDGTKKAHFWQIFKYKRLVINFFCMAAIYFVCGMGYYGVSQYIGQMMGDIHVNVALSGAMLIPGSLAATFLLHLLSRRTFLMISNFVSGIFMLIVVLVPPEYRWVRVIMACICNSAYFISFIIVFLYGVELFPTTMRNSVLGVLTVLARAGQISAPPINHLPETVSGSIFGGLAILGGILCIPLPETKHIDLPSSLEDSKTLPRNKTSLQEEENTGVNIANY